MDQPCLPPLPGTPSVSWGTAPGPVRITARGTGGTWDVPAGEGSPDPVSIGIVTDAVGFCRLVANRVTPADLDLHVTGDPHRAAGVLAAAAALALD